MMTEKPHPAILDIEEDMLGIRLACGSVVATITMSSNELAMYYEEEVKAGDGLSVTVDGVVYDGKVYAPLVFPTCPGATVIEAVTYPFPSGAFTPDPGYTNSGPVGAGFTPGEVATLLGHVDKVARRIIQEYAAAEVYGPLASNTTFCVSMATPQQSADATRQFTGNAAGSR